MTDGEVETTGPRAYLAHFAPPPMKPMGRKSKFTPKVFARMIEAARMGLSDDAIAAWAGIGARTFIDWKRLGRGDETTPPVPHFAKMLEALDDAKLESEALLVARIQTAAFNPKHWPAAAWLLERRLPHKYAKTVRVQGQDGGPIQIAITLPDDLKPDNGEEDEGS